MYIDGRRRYIIKMKVLTPVYIGLGQEGKEMRGLGFVLNGRELYLRQDYFDLLSLDVLKKIYNEIKRGGGYNINNSESYILDFIKIIKNRGMDIPFYSYEPIVGNNGIMSNKRVGELHIFMGVDQDSPFIPGSSIKGSLKSEKIFEKKHVEGVVDFLTVRDVYVEKEDLFVGVWGRLHLSKGLLDKSYSLRMCLKPNTEFEVEVIWHNYGNKEFRKFYGVEEFNKYLDILFKYNRKVIDGVIRKLERIEIISNKDIVRGIVSDLKNIVNKNVLFLGSGGINYINHLYYKNIRTVNVISYRGGFYLPSFVEVVEVKEA